MTVHRYAMKEKDALVDAEQALARYRRNVTVSIAAFAFGLIVWVLMAFAMSAEILDEDYAWAVFVPATVIAGIGGVTGLALLVTANESSGRKHPAELARKAKRTYDRAYAAALDAAAEDQP